MDERKKAVIIDLHDRLRNAKPTNITGSVRNAFAVELVRMLDGFSIDTIQRGFMAIWDAAPKFFPDVFEIAEYCRAAERASGGAGNSGGGSDYYRNYRGAMGCSLPFSVAEYPQWNHSHARDLTDAEIKAVNAVRNQYPGTRQYPIYRSAYTRAGYVECRDYDDMRRIEAAQDWSGERANIGELVTESAQRIRA